MGNASFVYDLLVLLVRRRMARTGSDANSASEYNGTNTRCEDTLASTLASLAIRASSLNCGKKIVDQRNIPINVYFEYKICQQRCSWRRHFIAQCTVANNLFNFRFTKIPAGRCFLNELSAVCCGFAAHLLHYNDKMHIFVNQCWQQRIQRVERTGVALITRSA